MNKLPNRKELSAATIAVLQKANGELKTSEINFLVAKFLDIPQNLLEIEDANCTGTEFSYQMRWVRTALKQQNLITSHKRGTWKLV